MICQKHNDSIFSCACTVKPKEQPKDAIGDVNSTARGSGARFNGGKPDFALVPLRIVADSYPPQPYGHRTQALRALRLLGQWQETGTTRFLVAALWELGLDGWDECAQVFDYGRKKYSEWNWAKGMAWSIPTACAARHLMKIINGADVDDESELPHRGHVFSNLVMLLTYAETFPEGDDRPRLLSPESL